MKVYEWLVCVGNVGHSSIQDAMVGEAFYTTVAEISVHDNPPPTRQIYSIYIQYIAGRKNPEIEERSFLD